MTVVTVFLFCQGSNQVSADGQAVLKPLDRPDRASVSVPNMVAAPDDDHYIFHKSGVSYERAFSDLDECRMYSLSTYPVAYPLPKFVPLGSETVKSATLTPTNQYGIAGALIGVIVLQNMADDEAQAINRRCLAFKGYRRYGTSREAWDKINAGSDAEKLARMALVASGPQPAAGDLGP